METKKRTKTDSAQRIYKLLHRNPGLTTNEIMQHMPDLSTGAVQVAVSRMHQRGEIERRSKKQEVGPTGRMTPHYTYHVKYNSRSKPKIKRKPPAKVLRTVETPVVEMPKVVNTQPVRQPPVVKPEPEGPKTPTAEREVLVLRHLTDIYKALNIMTEQQDALIEVLKSTLLDLAETKDELEAARKARSFWGTVKGWFE